ncbi:ABC transporter ATP-binding protein [Candidatus Poribacteria bacterium]
MHRFHGPPPSDPNEEQLDSEKPQGIRENIVYWLRKGRDDLVKSSKTYIRLLRYARPYLHLAVFILILAIVSTFISVLSIQMMGAVIDEISRSGSDRGIQETRNAARDTTGPAKPPSIQKSLPVVPTIRRVAFYLWDNWMPDRNPSAVTIYVIAAAFLLLHFTTSGISIIRSFIMARLGQTIIFDMRNNVYQHIQKLSLRYFAEHKTGDVMSRVINDVNSLQSVIVGPIIGFVTDIFRMCWALYFCLLFDWRLTLLALLVGPPLGLSTFIFGLIMRKIYRLIRQKIGELNALLQDNLSGIRVIKGFAREEHELGRFREKSDENRRLNIKIARMHALFSPAVGTLMRLGSLFILLYGGLKVLNGEMTAGVFVTFSAYISMLYGPIMGMSRFFTSIIRALTSVERVFEVLDTEPDIADKEDAIQLPVIRGEVEFRDVSFSYTEEVEVLKNVSLKATPGQMIAFVGPSGAGKTTAVNLVPRFYDPTEGNIFIDGHNLKDIKQRSLRKQMGIVLQEPFLFNNTVKASIAYGKLGATDEETVDAAKAANAHDFIEQLPKGYDTVIGERGVKLSGGQRQRISIARAILADPRILILDEATSAVDTETEMLIQDAIQRLVRDRTTFVIAHRLSTIHNADLIVVLDGGHVVEMGTHDELLANDGLYSRLHRVQFRVPDDDVGKKQPALRRRPSDRPAALDDEKLDQMIDDDLGQSDDWQGDPDS